MNRRIGQVDIQVVDNDDGFLDQVTEEIERVYNLDVIPFAKGDVVLDIGAHVGLVSLYLAKQHPDISIHAYEPVPENFERLKQNIKANRATNVRPHNLAVTSDGSPRVMVRGEHTGGATAFHAYEREPFTVQSTTMYRIFRQHRIKRVRLLKLDCEGAEHEILAHGDGWLDRVQHIRGEIHKVETPYSAIQAAVAAGVPDIQWTFAY